ncbi:MAG: hypothetical protein K0U52_03500 [Gammaproteobacteria bacterium]|nr:hypothetical protein [Gammaproteobacteria bacterium]
MIRNMAWHGVLIAAGMGLLTWATRYVGRTPLGKGFKFEKQNWIRLFVSVAIAILSYVDLRLGGHI